MSEYDTKFNENSESGRSHKHTDILVSSEGRLRPYSFSLPSFICASSQFSPTARSPPNEFHVSVLYEYPKVSGQAAWSENCKGYSSLPPGVVASLFCESV
jgi:hypothetical protein